MERNNTKVVLNSSYCFNGIPNSSFTDNYILITYTKLKIYFNDSNKSVFDHKLMLPDRVTRFNSSALDYPFLHLKGQNNCFIFLLYITFSNTKIKGSDNRTVYASKEFKVFRNMFIDYKRVLENSSDIIYNIKTYTDLKKSLYLKKLSCIGVWCLMVHKYRIEVKEDINNSVIYKELYLKIKKLMMFIGIDMLYLKEYYNCINNKGN